MSRLTLRQFFCGLRGHADTLRFEPTRLSLRCELCQRQSAGWSLSLGRPSIVRRGTAIPVRRLTAMGQRRARVIPFRRLA